MFTSDTSTKLSSITMLIYYSSYTINTVMLTKYPFPGQRASTTPWKFHKPMLIKQRNCKHIWFETGF